MRLSSRLYPGQLAAWIGPSAGLLPKRSTGTGDGSIDRDADAWLSMIRPIRCTPSVLGIELGVSSALADALDWSAAYGGTSVDSMHLLAPTARSQGGTDTSGAVADVNITGEDDTSALGVADIAACARLAKTSGIEASLLSR